MINGLRQEFSRPITVHAYKKKSVALAGSRPNRNGQHMVVDSLYYYVQRRRHTSTHLTIFFLEHMVTSVRAAFFWLLFNCEAFRNIIPPVNTFWELFFACAVLYVHCRPLLPYLLFVLFALCTSECRLKIARKLARTWLRFLVIPLPTKIELPKQFSQPQLMGRTYRIFATFAGVAVLGLLPSVIAHGHDEDMDMSMVRPTMSNLTEVSPVAVPMSYFRYSENSALLIAHISLMTISWVFVLPIGELPFTNRKNDILTTTQA